jgi:hypothetical protein
MESTSNMMKQKEQNGAIIAIMDSQTEEEGSHR